MTFAPLQLVNLARLTRMKVPSCIIIVDSPFNAATLHKLHGTEEGPWPLIILGP